MVFSRIARRHCPALYHTLEYVHMKRTQSSSNLQVQFFLSAVKWFCAPWYLKTMRARGVTL